MQFILRSGGIKKIDSLFLTDEIHLIYEEDTNMQRTLKKKTSNHYFQINMLIINISGWRTCSGSVKELEHRVFSINGYGHTEFQ